MNSPRLIGWSAVRSIFVLTVGAALAMSCGREPTSGAGGGVGHIVLKPLFQTTGGNDNKGFDQPVTLRVIVSVVNPAGSALRVTQIASTDIPFASVNAEGDNEDQITVKGTYPLQADGSQYEVSVQGINATGVVTYNIGPLSFTSAQANTGAVTVQGQAVYVGPGSNATKVTIAPHGGSTTIGSNTPLTLTAQAFAGTAALPLALYDWTSLDPSIANVNQSVGSTGQDNVVTINTAGRGTARIVVSVEPTGVADTVLVTVIPNLQSINVVSGQGQNANAGSTLPNQIVVRAGGGDGLPLGGVTVTFAAQSGGSANPATAVTGPDGTATTTWTLGTASGNQTMNITAALNGTTQQTSVTASATATASNGATQISLVSGGGQTVAAGATVQSAIQILAKNATGAVVNGAQISITYFGQSPVTFPTNSSGIASFMPTVPASTAAGSYTMSVQISGIPTSAISVPITVTAAAAVATTIAKVSGDNQSVQVGHNFGAPLTVKVTDQNGNAMSGVSVNWATGSSSINAQTDASGQNSQLYQVPAGTTPGPGSITVTITGTSKSVVFSYTSTP